MSPLIDSSGNIGYFGRLSWGNFIDWLVTLCLGAIMALLTVSLGGARPDSYAQMLPLFGLLLVLHGLWLGLEREDRMRISYVPLYFVPLLLWMAGNLAWVSPVAWRGWYELIYALGAFIFFWVVVNNVRTRAHTWVLIATALSPLGYAMALAAYQFFQRPGALASSSAAYALQLSPKFLGQATGCFADPSSLVVCLLVVLPVLLVFGAVPRLATSLRLLSLYIAFMLLGAILFAQVFWSIGVLLLVVALLPWLCFLRPVQRRGFSLLGVLLLAAVLLLLALGVPQFGAQASVALSHEGEAVRAILWPEALRMVSTAPLAGVGAGGFAATFAQSPAVALADLPITPHNDYLLLVSQYGIVGLLLFLGPSVWVLWRAGREWRAAHAEQRRSGVNKKIASSKRFFLSAALGAVLVFALCLFTTYVFYIPALTLYGLLFFAILVKFGFQRRWSLPLGGGMRIAYVVGGCLLAWGFYHISAPRIQAQAIELHARQRFDQVVQQRLHFSFNTAFVDEVIEQYQAAARLDPANADVWIGLSAAQCQLYFRDPMQAEQIAAQASESARRAIALSEGYGMAWAQLGVAQALGGDWSAAERALSKAVALAPNNSNAHYYWAAYQSHFDDRRSAALASVRRALEINPSNAAARRLQQKLSML